MELTPVGNTRENEVFFGADELFFSITDKESTILTSNELFISISGYTKDELVGSYHNIIRHPDMPRIVFKTLWDHIQADKPIVAYVKNRAKTGEFYWVLAAVFPLDNRYVSIRIKPSSKIFALIPDLYRALSAEEMIGGMEASGALLESILRSKGYEDYDLFMGDVLLHELSAHKAANTKNWNKTLAFSIPGMSAIYASCNDLLQEYGRDFEKTAFFIEQKDTIEAKSKRIHAFARDMIFLSLNASVSSYKSEKGGETFGVLAGDIRTNAKENDGLVAEIHLKTTKLSNTLLDAVFDISSLAMQLEMVTYFMQECARTCNESIDLEMRNNLHDLMKLIREYAKKLSETHVQIARQIAEVLALLDRLDRQMEYMSYIQTFGMIEAASSDDAGMRFSVIFSELKVFLEQTSSEIASMRESGRLLLNGNRMLMGIEGDKKRLFSALTTYIQNI